MPHATAARNVARDRDAVRYHRHRPEQTLLYRIIEQHYPAFTAYLAAQGRVLPGYDVQREFEDYLKCGRLEHGFLRVRCESCHTEHLVAFSCKRRGFCPSYGARRMAESAALLMDEVFPEQPVRQWVLSFPYPLRFLFASRQPPAASRQPPGDPGPGTVHRLPGYRHTPDQESRVDPQNGPDRRGHPHSAVWLCHPQGTAGEPLA